MIIYNGKNSLTDFDLYPASKEIPVPTRKTVTETVPYMSGLWDFSFHDGDVDEYEALKIKYTFDVIADTKAELNAEKAALIAWVHSRGDQKLYDTDISKNEYYSVYHASAGWSENDLQGLLTVEFTCYPFRKTEMKTVTFNLSDIEQIFSIHNEGHRPIMPNITVTGATSLKDGVNNFKLSAGTYHGKTITLKAGANTLTAVGSGTLTVEYWAEVL